MFVAAYPPAEVAAAASAAVTAALTRRVRDDASPAHRLTPIGQVHLTLLFIGDTAPGDLDDVRESVARSARGLAGFALRPKALITLPPRGPARLVALTTDAPPVLLELQHRLAVRLARKARPSSTRPFLPHLTLCRFRSPTRLARFDEPVTLPTFTVREIALMRSTLRPTGAEHVEIDHVTLSKT